MANHFYYTRGTTLASTLDIGQAFISGQTLNTNTTLSTTNNFIKCSGNTTLTLPTAVGNDWFIFWFFKTDSAATTITINTTGGQTINGHASVTFTPQFYVFVVISDGANWLVLQNGVQLA